jgi:hypothetical protein
MILCWASPVMAGLVPAIQRLYIAAPEKVVDGRAKPGHDTGAGRRPGAEGLTRG